MTKDRTVKISITIPSRVLDGIDRIASDKEMTRSRIITSMCKLGLKIQGGSDEF